MYPPASGPQCAPARRQPLAVILSILLLLQLFPLSRPTLAVTNGGGITAFDTPLTENFNGLASSGTPTWVDNSTIPGWYSSRTAYTPGTGSGNAGALYSFGVAGTNPATDRALGSVASGSSGTIAQGVKLTNNTGATITSLDVSYVGEQWRNGGNTTTQKLQFQYQIANAGTVANINAGTWTAFTALDFSSLVNTATAAALDGNAPANRAAKSSTLTVTVNSGQEIWLRWVDTDDAGNDHGLAIDDFSATAHGAGPTNPSGVGTASPNSVTPGGTTLLTVAVTPGSSPVSTGLGVTADLTAIGGVAGQTFYDDGTHGDVTAGDKTFSFSATVANATSGGAKSLPFSVTDAQSRSGGGNIALTVLTPTNPSGTGAALPSTVQAGGSTLLTVAVTPGTNPTSTGLTVTGDLSSIGGSASQTFYDDGSNGDVTANDNTFSYGATVAAASASGIKSLPVQIADAQARTASTSISLSVQDAPVPAGALVISQVYGGGGNAGADYKNDFVEIFNRSTQAVNLSGWSVQYGSSGGTTWQRTPLTNFILQPGQYYLVQESAGSGGTLDLPTPDATGTILMSGTAAKIALVRNNVSLSGTTCSEWLGDPDLIDFVGYGTASNCFAGTGPAPTLSNTTAALRTRNGCKDTDVDNLDFVERAPAPRNSASSPHVCPVGDLPPEVYSTDPASGGTNFPLAGNVTVTFDTAVNVADGGFTLSCSTSGAHTLAVTGGPTVFTLNPDTDLVSGETCTAAVLATHVSSQATTPVPMVADYTWTFTALVVRDPSEHMVMGNPSGAVADENVPLNYLMMKPQYALSYNNEKGTSNWTSWHLDSTWTTGVADRQNDFRADSTLPASFKHVQNGYNFATYGFDRGHMTPSADRTSSLEDNSATFLMSNMVPQASGNNQGPWNNLEGHIRTLLNGSANELYIVSGGHGVGGNSSTGHWDTITDTGGNIVTVPNVTWKVVMVLPRADGDDVARVNTSTRTFAVIMPNNDNIREDDWKKYIATVDQVEALTGYNFFSNVPEEIQNVIEAQLDSEYDTAPVADSQSVSTPEDTQKAITLSASDFNVNNTLSYTVVSGPAHGVLDGTGSALTYTPEADYNGPDSFTFKANDGDKDSNTATVSISVTAVNDAPTANADAKTTDEDAALTFPAADLSANDTAGPANEGGQALSVTSVISGGNTHGTVSLAGGQVTYTPDANYNGAASFTYQVCDNGTTAGSPDSKCATADVEVSVGSVNDAPSLAAIGDKSVDEETQLTFTAVGSDAHDSPPNHLTYSLAGAPAGAGIDPASGVFNWTPTEVQGQGSYTFTVRVTDDGTPGLSAEETINVTVREVNVAPSAANVPSTLAGPWGEPLSFTATATDQDVTQPGDQPNTLTFSLKGAPAGATINPSTGAFSWTPQAAQVGSYNFKVRVTDDGSPNLYDELPISVTVDKRATTLAYTGDTSGPYSGTASLSARLEDTGLQHPLSGKTVTFTIGAQNSPSAATGATGVAQSSIQLTQDTGTYTASASFAGDDSYLPSNGSQPFTIEKANQTINWANPSDIVYGTPLGAAQLNATVTTVGPSPAGALTYTPAAGTVLDAGNGQTLSVSVAGTNNYNPASASVTLNVLKAPSSLTASAPAFVANGGAATLTGVLKGVGNAPLVGRALTLTLGSGAGAQVCSATTDASGTAACTVAVVNQPLGPGLAVTAAYGGESNYQPSAGAASTFVFAYATTGVGFVIGDQNASVGSAVTFWGSQWAKSNSLSGGSAPNSFKGFASHGASACGVTWLAEPGNSSNVPATVPAYMAVLVASSISKSGSTISGNTSGMVIVRTNPGYADSPGHAGTGTVVGVLCQ